MPKSRKQKEKEVQELVDRIKKAKIAFITTQTGIDVKTIYALRQALKKENIEFLASKKTLVSLALKEIGIPDFNVEGYEGIVATVFGYDDEVSAPNKVFKFVKTNPNMQIQAGILEGSAVSKEIIMSLAKLPSKDELRAKFVGVINGPIYGFVNVLAGNLRGFVRALDQIREKQAKA